MDLASSLEVGHNGVGGGSRGYEIPPTQVGVSLGVLRISAYTYLKACFYARLRSKMSTSFEIMFQRAKCSNFGLLRNATVGNYLLLCQLELKWGLKLKK